MPVEVWWIALLGFGLDFLFGDPSRLPHVVRGVGWLAAKGEAAATRLLGRSIVAGLLLWLSTLAIVVGAYLVIAQGLGRLSPWLRVAFDGFVLFQAMAFRDLDRHVGAVADGLRKGLASGRLAVGRIVGRDTDRMEEADVCRAAIESGSENLNDAVIAPLFWFVFLGPVGALAYRVCNTLDAVVGHRSPRFEKLGKVSARVDDTLNFLPARLCAALELQLADLKALPRLAGDAAKHPSINSGWPEAAMARRLGVVIGGKMYANGALVQTAEMNEGGRQPRRDDIARARSVMLSAYLKALLLGTIVLWASKAGWWIW